ncbi:YaiO family outer membrane beta-barrel protein [Labrys sp. ZIDIC5]|uniref:YaiO family outer membrane beta-barrel protein n=1 Tax=Labrys sedimenti TaxID=3106036 RepID=UPI002ACA2F2C|nr:YaiO family outer membrane beta-barrel protein [Labrys sp. ZIDIC5]MDZ5453334.1 YaiO family outer membrane beta-barrel protein [Labrys sp. ZIDIC5]
MKGRAGAVALTLLLALGQVASAQTPDELYASGVKARQQQHFDEAADLFKRVLAQKPDNTDALVQLGFVELGRNDLAAARESFSKTLTLAPAYADAKFGLAEIEFRSGNLDAALGLIESLAKEHPDNGDFAQLLANLRKAQAAKKQVTTARPVKPSPAKASHPSKPLPSKPRPDPVAALLEKGRKLRNAGRFAQAEQIYREALKRAPRNTDVLVALGLVAGFQQKFGEADRFFDEALRIKSSLLDARLGKVRLALWQGDVALARARIDAILTEAPGNSEALVLEGRIAMLEGDHVRAAQAYRQVLAREPRNGEALVGLGDISRAEGDDDAARQAYRQALAIEPNSQDIAQRLAVPPPRKWRFDIGSEVSALTAGQGNWTDSIVGLSYRLTPSTTLSGKARLATRFGQTDVQVEGRIDHAFSSRFSAYALVAATPSADFLARYSVGAGASWQAVSRTNGVGPLFLNVDARYDDFADTRVTTISPWIQGYVFDGRLGLSARWVHARDDADTRADGYVLRADVVVTPRLSLFAGYADAPEISDGSLVPTRSVFGGAAYDLTDDLTLRASFAHERRRAFDRNTFGLGLTTRF